MQALNELWVMRPKKQHKKTAEEFYKADLFGQENVPGEQSFGRSSKQPAIKQLRAILTVYSTYIHIYNTYMHKHCLCWFAWQNRLPF